MALLFAILFAVFSFRSSDTGWRDTEVLNQNKTHSSEIKLKYFRRKSPFQVLQKKNLAAARCK